MISYKQNSDGVAPLKTRLREFLQSLQATLARLAARLSAYRPKVYSRHAGLSASISLKVPRVLHRGPPVFKSRRCQFSWKRACRAHAPQPVCSHIISGYSDTGLQRPPVAALAVQHISLSSPWTLYGVNASGHLVRPFSPRCLTRGCRAGRISRLVSSCARKISR
jgi:hypothetical protein